MENLVAVGVFLFLFSASAVAGLWLSRKGRRKSRLPFPDKMLRPPGYSLRRKLEKMDDRLLHCFSFLAFMAATASLFLLAGWSQRHSPVLVAISLAAAVGIMAVPIRSLAKLGAEMANHRLGLLGEEVVGEHLNRLMLDGCEVFHDVPGDGKWNVDHVVVSPRGVFAVETKTRRKQEVKDGHKVTFTGTELQFPTWTDSHGLKQAKENAEWLGRFLTKATGEPAKTSAILTLPGWMVELRGKNCVSVLNPKQIRQVVLNDRLPFLDEGQRKRICHQLEQRCRDVEV